MDALIFTFVVFAIGLAVSVYFYLQPLNPQGKQVAFGFMIVCSIVVGGFVLQPLLTMLPHPDDD